MKIYLSKVFVKNGKLRASGYCEEVNAPDEIVFIKDRETIEADVKKSVIVQGKYCFEFSTKVSSLCSIIFPGDLYFQKFSTFADDRKAILSSGYKLKIDGRKIICKKANAIDKLSVKFSLALHYLLTHQKVFLNRLLARKIDEEIWLYCDRENLIDNAYYQFLHDAKIDDGVKRFYIISSEDAKKNFPDEFYNKLVNFKSNLHKKLFFNAKKIISSFSSMSIISPFGSDPTAFYYDLLDFEFIYLQHGVLHADLKEMYAKENTFIDKVVVSSEFECKNFCENYGYNEEDLIRCGMARYDFADKSAKAQNKILFAPSWRGNLIGVYKNNKREKKTEEFLQSVFYKETQKFLESERLNKILEENDLYLDFKNHPIFSCYNDCFKVENDRIKISSGDTKTDEYILMITDYSSIVFDFVYLQRPVIYFVPDYDDFKNGISHSYNKLDLPLEAGFGLLAYDSDTVLSELESLVQTNFSPKSPYKERMESFFIFDDNKQRERLFNSIKNL